MWSMVNRRSGTGTDLGASQAVSPLEALKAYTRLGAWSGFEEGDKGSLEVGKLADFVVLDRDLFAIDPQKIRDIRPVMTFVGGKLQYQA